jgi:predicted nucleotide-binding protein
MFYHIRLLTTPGRGEIKLDLTKEELIKRYVEPYLTGETIVINGTTLDPHKLHRVNISCSEETMENIIRSVEEKNSKTENPLNRRNPLWIAFEEGKDITDTFIHSAPGSKSKQKNVAQTSQTSNKVFVVHGHDIELKNDVELFLRRINLEPIVLHRQPDEGLTVIEKFEKHAGETNYAFVLLTPDDIGYPIAEQSKKDEERKIEYRARQNVILEFGFFVGKLGRKNVCCIYKEGVAVPSDLHGLIYKQVRRSVEEVAMQIMKDLKIAGVPFKFE